VLNAVNADGTTTDGSSLIDEIVREGARRMPAAALEAEATGERKRFSSEILPPLCRKSRR
jgi:hypothetical protein